MGKRTGGRVKRKVVLQKERSLCTMDGRGLSQNWMGTRGEHSPGNSPAKNM